jgi:hypothetical protein
MNSTEEYFEEILIEEGFRDFLKNTGSAIKKGAQNTWEGAKYMANDMKDEAHKAADF